jgi:hypothetical protein
MALKQSQLLAASYGMPDQFAEQSSRRWLWKLDSSKFKFADLLNPEVYKLIGDRLTPGDVISVLGSQGDYDCDLRVVAADRGYCLVRPIRTWFANAVEARDSENKEPCIKFVPGRGYVVMSETGEPISAHLVEHEAQDALQAYLADKAAA